MADPNMPPLPPGFTLDAPQAPAFGGRPVIQEPPPHPTPQTPEQRRSTETSTELTDYNLRTKPVYDRATAIDKVRDGYRQDKRVLNFEAALPVAISGLQSPEDAAGDNLLVNAMAKVSDPSTGVQAREGASWENAQPQADQLKAQMLKQFGTDGYGNFTPEGRTKIRETLRVRLKVLGKQYDQARGEYDGYIKSLNLPDSNADTIIGPHAYQPFARDEEAYIEAHGGTPKVAGVPVGAPPEAKGRFGDDFGAAGTRIQFNDEAETRTRAKRFHDDLYNALADRQIKSPADVNAWVQQFNQQNHTGFAIDWRNKDTRLAIRAAMTGKKFGVETPPDPAVQQKVDQYKAQRGTDATDAYNVGAEDAVTVGTAPRIAAAGAAIRGSLSGDGSFGDLYSVNLDANRQYMNTLQEQHPYASAAGELTGGLALPGFGARTPAQMALLGLGYGGVYGANQGDSSTTLTQRAGNAAVGAAAGAATGYLGTEFLGAGRMGQALADRNALLPRPAPRTIPPLVDPATGELNQPMDAMRPGERVQSMQDYGMKTITPGMAGGRSARVVEQGFNNVPGSAGHMEDVNSASSGELRRSMQGVAQRFGSSKTLNEGGSELQRGANEWMGRADKVTTKVYDAISIPPQTKAATSDTVATLQQLTNKIKSNPELAAEANDPVLRRYLDAIQGKGLDWEGLKEFRSYIGEKGGEFRFSQDARKGAYQALYGALSEDMRNTARSLGSKQLHEFERANSFYAAKEKRIEGALAKILGPSATASPEKAAAAVQAMTKGGNAKGDLAALAQVKASMVKSGAWGEMASTLIHLGGQPANSEGRAFQPATFVNWYADMAEPARKMLFPPELRKALDGFVAMNQQLSRVRGLNNTSNTTPTIIGSTGVSATGILAATGHPLLAAGVVAGGAANYGMARAWTSPIFVRLVTGYSRAAASGNPNAVRSQVGRLSKLAATNPELRDPIEHLLKSLANDNAVPAVAASTEPGGNQQN